MEIILELLLTAFVALLFSFLIAKLVSFAMDADSGMESKSSIHADDDDDVADIVMERLDLVDEFKVQSFESENKVDFVKESCDDNNNKVDVFELVVDDDDQGFECENKVERSKVEAFERELEVDLKAKLDDIVVKNEIEEIEVQNEIKVQSEESQMKGLVEEEEKGMKLESYDDDDDDDWEGIEKSELENVFGAAAKFSEQKGDLGIGNDVEMELYGLHKIATEGACRESQPLAFMFSSRSKWNAWQRLGNMNPEAAMEQYVTLLSDKVPGWMEDDSDVSPLLFKHGFVHGERKLESAAGAVPGSMAPDKQAIFTHQRNADLKSAPGGGDITASTSSEKQVKDD